MPSRRNTRRLRAEVRLDDRRVPDDLLRCPLRDRAPLLQHEDPVGHAQDGPHHVLDHHGPEPDLRLHPLEHLDGVPHLIRRKARERLVEQEEAGPRREGTPELEPLLLLDGEGGSEGVRAGLELDEAEDSLDLFGKVRPFVHGGTPSERRGHEDVLPGGQAKYLRASGTYCRIVPMMPPGRKRAIRRTDTPMAIGSPWGRMRRRIWCGIRTITAPSIGPRTVPMPPMMIMASIVREKRRLKLSGNTPDTYHAKTAPAAPANAPP